MIPSLINLQSRQLGIVGACVFEAVRHRGHKEGLRVPHHHPASRIKLLESSLPRAPNSEF
jgi:hypothetical protein